MGLHKGSKGTTLCAACAPLFFCQIHSQYRSVGRSYGLSIRDTNRTIYTLRQLIFSIPTHFLRRDINVCIIS